MTAETDLLPLPEWTKRDDLGGLVPSEVRVEMCAYARANVAHAVASKDAEIEALRAEVEDYRENGASAVRFAHTSAHWSAELRRLFGDDARGGIEVLEQRHRDSLARAERLAEALRDAADDIDAGVSPADVAAHLRARADLLRDQEAGRG